MGYKDYSEIQDIFIEFLNMTEEEKLDQFGFNTQREFAAKYNLPHEKLLSEWKANTKFQHKRQKAFMRSFGDILPAARKTLRSRAVEDGDVNALKEVFKIAGVSIERVEQVSNDDIQEVVATVIEVMNEVLDGQQELKALFVKKLEDKLGDMF